MPPWAARVITLTVACLLTGWLASFAGEPNGTGYAIWPPVGIGLVGLLAGGGRLWPGVWVPTFVLALRAVAEAAPGLPPGTVVGTAAAVAVVYTVQAAVGAWLVQRWVGYPAPLVRVRDVVVFLLLVGPVHTVLAAAVGTVAGAAAGAWPQADLPAVFRVWWWADAVSGLVFAPVALALAGQPREVWRPRRLTVAAPLLVSAAAVVAGFLYAARLDDARAAEQVRSEADHATAVLSADVDRVVAGLNTFRQDFPGPSSDRWENNRAFIEAELRMLRRTSELVRAAEVSRLVPAPDPPPDAGPGRPGSAAGPGRADALVLLVADPTSLRNRTVGAEVQLDPARRAAVDRAVRTNAAAATGKTFFTHDPTRTPAAVYVYLPFYSAPGGGSKADRSAAGVIGVGFDLDRAQAAVGPGRDTRLRFDLAETAGHLPPLSTGGQRVTRPVKLADRDLILATTAPPEFLADQRTRRAGLVSAAGFGMVGLLAALLLVVTGRTAVVAEEVDIQTQALREEVAVREFTEAWLRASEGRLAEAQRIARLGYWEFDPVDRAVHLSAEAATLLGDEADRGNLTWEDLIARVHPDDRAEVEGMADAATDGDRTQGFEFRVVRADGEVRWIAAAFRRPEDEDSVLVVQGVLQDITERKTGELALRASEGRLAEAQRVAKLGYWDWYPDTGEATWSAEMYRVMGVSPDDFRPSTETVPSVIHPDDRPLIEAANRMILGPGAEDQISYEFRTAPKDGRVRVLHTEGHAFRDPAGRVVRVSGVTQDVTERVEAEAARRESEERFRRAFDSSGIGMALVGLDGRFLQANPALCSLLGYTEDELRATDFQALTHPDDLGIDLGHLRRIVAGETQTYQIEKRYRHRDGRTVWASLTVAAVRGADGSLLYFISQVKDITAKRKAEEDLRDRERQLRDLGDNLPGGAVFQFVRRPDRSIYFTYISAGVAAATGVTADEAMADAWATHRLIHPDDLPRVFAAGDESERNLTPYELEFRQFTPAGALKWLYVRSRPERLADGGTLWNGILQDVTERKQAEIEKQKFDARLQETQKLESLGVLAGGVAHDFNNLLTGVLGNASLARELIPADSELHEFLRPIEKSAEHAAQLCQQMLAYAGRGTTVRGPVDLNRLTEESADLLRVSVPRTAAVRFEPGPDLPTLTADPGQLRQVLLNLVHNAAEALDGGGGMVTVTTGAGSGPPSAPTGAAWSGQVPAGRHAWLEVADTGHGMAPGTLARVFEPFFTTKFTGRGLGLSAVHGIVRSHGGAIMVASRVGQGTRFRVYLPAEDAADRQDPLVETPPQAAGRCVAGGVALVAEDDPTARATAAVALRSQGLTVVEVADGRDAVAHVRDHPGRFAVAVVDLLMTGESGRSCAREVRRLAPDLPVVLVTRYAGADLGEWEASNGVQVVAKPFRPADLTASVRRLLGRSALATPAEQEAEGSPCQLGR